MLINYEKSKFVKEEWKIEIEDTHNCYLEGKNEYNNITEYLAIYMTKKWLVIVEIQNRSQKNIIVDYGNKNSYTEPYIKNFLETHKEVRTISEETFKSKLNNILEVLNDKQRRNRKRTR